MKLGAVFLAAALTLVGARTANAALTSSEKGQIRDFVSSARAENAVRVRSLVARTDLTADESISALSEAVEPVAFTEQRAVFLRELAFGVASASARPLLAQAVTHALLRRADVVFLRYVGGLDHEPRAISELIAIYAFIDGTIANAGRPTLTAHDPTAGISAAAYDACSKELREHVDRNARWLKGDGAVAESLGRVRAQAQAALLDMLPDGLTRRVDAADRLDLKGARRAILTEWGILLADAGKLDDAAAGRVHDALARLPGARVDLELVYVGDDRGPLRTRGIVAHAGGAAAEANPFGEELTPTKVDPLTSSIIQDLAVFAVRRALDNRGELRLQAEHDAAAALGDARKTLGKPRAPSVEHVIGSVAHLLVLDAPRTLDLAFVRALGGRPEGAALLSDAIGALAAFPASSEGNAGPSIELGKENGATKMTAIRLAPNGSALGFTLEGHAWTITRGSPANAVTGITRDTQVLSLAQLATARTPLKDTAPWTEGSLTFTKLRGTPRAAILAAAEKGGAPTVKLVGSSAKGYDAIATAAPGEDFVLEGDLSVSGAPGGVAFRATNGRDGVRGAMFIVVPGGRAALVTSDEQGVETPLASPLDPAPSLPAHVKITVKGTKVEAVVGATTLTGTLPATLAKGEVGLVAKNGATVDLAGFSLAAPKKK